jgi:hypothetical protein
VLENMVAGDGVEPFLGSSPSKRLIHGECIPVSKATRLRGIPPNTSPRALAVVLTFCSSNTSPASSSMHYQLLRSPRSSPIASLSLLKFFVTAAPVVLIFFIAGLLYLLCLKHVDNLGANGIPSETGLLISSVQDNRGVTDASAIPKTRIIVEKSGRRQKIAFAGGKDETLF